MSTAVDRPSPVRTIVAGRSVVDALAFVDKPTTLTPGQRERAAVVWADGERSARSGFWQCERGRFTARREASHELCFILSGRATLRDAAGNATEIHAGMLVVLPDGWDGTWEVHEPVEKVFVVVPA